MGCCDDPTEPEKINRVDLARAQEQYGNLLRDFFTSDPEQLMLKQLKQANNYIKELAAMNAHYDSVRQYAITMLEKESLSVLTGIVEKEQNSDLAQCATQRIEELENDKGFLGKIFN